MSGNKSKCCCPNYKHFSKDIDGLIVIVPLMIKWFGRGTGSCGNGLVEVLEAVVMVW